MAATAIQYDLFGEIEAAEQSASAAARAFLADTPWPDLIAWWLHPEAIQTRLHRGDVKASYRRGPRHTPGWAWATWRDGLRFEAGDDWQGWHHRPRWCIPWRELHQLRDARPDVTAQLHHLADGLGHPNAASWRWWTDPIALHLNGWHPSNLENEQQPDYYDGCQRRDTAYADRLQAWSLALDVVRDTTLAVHEPAN